MTAIQLLYYNAIPDQEHSTVAKTTMHTLPFDTLPAPPCRPRAGALVIAAGIILMIIGVLAPTLGLYLLDSGFDVEAADVADLLVYLVLLIPVLLGFYGGVWLIARGRRMRAVGATALLAETAPAPVLFLRSFDDDDLVDPTPRMLPLGDLFERRYEESLGSALEHIGPMVSIGRPGNRLVQLGGARLFVPDHAWRTAVAYLRKRAAAVLLVVGRSEGLWWEIESSLREVPLERLLFFFPYVEDARRRRSIWQRFFHVNPSRLPLSTKAYRRMEAERQSRYQLFRAQVQGLLTTPLPEALGRSQFVDFTADGQPRLLATVRPWWWPVTVFTPSSARMIVDLARTLRPFVDKLKKSPPANPPFF
jgi:hypothetical protein